MTRVDDRRWLSGWRGVGHLFLRLKECFSGDHDVGRPVFFHNVKINQTKHSGDDEGKNRAAEHQNETGIVGINCGDAESPNETLSADEKKI